MEVVIYVLLALLAFAAGAGTTYYMLQQRSTAQFRRSKEESDRLLAEAENQRRDAALAAKDEGLRLRTELDREITQRRKEIERIERRIEQKEETIDRKSTGLEGRETAVRKQEQSLESARESWEIERARRAQELELQHASRLEEVDVLRSQRLGELERVSNLTADEAKAELVSEVEAEARTMAARRLHEIEREIIEESDRRSRQILATAIQRVATDYVAEQSIYVVPLPSDDMKGRIIGREGRNIRAIEQATGVDLIVDDTPEAIMISSFDNVRQRGRPPGAGEAVADGRIHPARIEEVVNKCRPSWSRSCAKRVSASPTRRTFPASTRT